MRNGLRQAGSQMRTSTCRRAGICALAQAGGQADAHWQKQADGQADANWQTGRQTGRQMRTGRRAG